MRKLSHHHAPEEHSHPHSIYSALDSMPARDSSKAEVRRKHCVISSMGSEHMGFSIQMSLGPNPAGIKG